MSVHEYNVLIEIREVPGYPGYGVSLSGSQGQVWTRWQSGRWKRLTNTWRPMKMYVDQSGYTTTQVRKDGKVVHALLHHMILQAFVGPCPEGHVCRHLDDVKSNNKLKNLLYGTYLENYQDALRNGIVATGEKSPSARLKDDDVYQIRNLFDQGVPNVYIAKVFKITPSYVGAIGRRKKWSHLPEMPILSDRIVS